MTVNTALRDTKFRLGEFGLVVEQLKKLPPVHKYELKPSKRNSHNVRVYFR